MTKQFGFFAALIAEDSLVIVTATVEIEEKVSPFHFFVSAS
jgi:hypothetical protein